MSYDFVEDARDLLQKDPECSHIMIAAKPGSPDCLFSANVPSRRHLDWFRRRFEDLCERLERQYEDKEEG